MVTTEDVLQMDNNGILPPTLEAVVMKKCGGKNYLCDQKLEAIPFNVIQPILVKVRSSGVNLALTKTFSLFSVPHFNFTSRSLPQLLISWVYILPT